MERLKRNIKNNPNSFATPDQKKRLLAALDTGTKYSIAFKNDCTKLLDQLQPQIPKLNAEKTIT